MGKLFFFFPGHFVRKKGKKLSSYPFWQKAQKDFTVCGETCPHSFQLRAFISPLSTGTQFPFETYCPRLRPLWKATDVAKIIPACPLSCFIFLKEEKKNRGKRPNFALNHWTILHLSKSVCTRSAGLAKRAEPFTCSLRSVWSVVFSRPHACRRKQPPPIATANWGDSSHQQGISVNGGKSSGQTIWGCPQ